MNNSNILAVVTALVAVIIAIGGFLFPRTQGFGGTSNFDQLDVTDGYSVDSTTVIDGSGNWTGAISSSNAAVVSTFTQGGGCTASSTTANAGTIQSTDIDTENCITYTPNVSDVTLTLPASTTAMCPSTTGQVRSFFIRNATGTAGIDISIAGGTGITLKRATSTGGSLIQGDTDASNFARIDVTKISTTDCVALMTIYND